MSSLDAFRIHSEQLHVFVVQFIYGYPTQLLKPNLLIVS